MWQVLLAAAAAAGSGVLAKKLISPGDSKEPVSSLEQNGPECAQIPAPEENPTKDSTFPSDEEERSELKEAGMCNDGSIFRFSSPEMGPRNFRKKMVGGSRGVRKNGAGKVRKKCDGVKGLVLEQRKSGKRFSLCLKKRKTSKNAGGKCESCASKDNPLSSELIVGIMHLISAGKSEFSKLNSTVDETAKVVQELKAEISKRKASSHHHSGSEIEAEISLRRIHKCHDARQLTKSNTENKDKHKVSGHLTEEGECLSSVLTEEELPEVLQMDQLQEELECELLKLPWCDTEGFGLEIRPDNCKADVFREEMTGSNCENSTSYEFGGVPPSLLDQKLCHLLIEQQEGQITELENELQITHSKLHEKEAELQALKDCVKRLTEFSLVTASDDEIEVQMEDKKFGDHDEDKLQLESKKEMVGMKRAMDL